MAVVLRSGAILALATGATALSLTARGPVLQTARSAPAAMILDMEPKLATASAPAALTAADADVDKIFQRCEWWDVQQATKLEVINVLGRWDSATEWAERTQFSEVTDVRATSMKQSATRSRYEMAQRNNVVERVALQQNAPNMPFKNAALAASVGRTVADFQAMPVTKAAVNVVFDALVESRNGLIPPEVCLATSAV